MLDHDSIKFYSELLQSIPHQYTCTIKIISLQQCYNILSPTTLHYYNYFNVAIIYYLEEYFGTMHQ